MSRLPVLCSFVLVTAALSACAEKPDEALPPAGLAGAPAPAHGAASPGPAAPSPASAPRMSPHGPMTSHGAAPSSQPAGGMPTVVPGDGTLPPGAAGLQGTVKEALHVKDYTYLLVKQADGKEEWAAVLKDESIKAGTTVALGGDTWMEQFQSPSLNRTFDRILFGRVVSKK